jgi:acyl carrier protein
VSQSNSDKIKRVMADILNLDANSINDGTSTDNTPLWDSANHIQLVLALEEEFSISFEVTEFEVMLSFAEIVKAVQSKLGGQSQ